MTRRASVLDALEPASSVNIHPDDLAELGIAPNALIALTTRRGQLNVEARSDGGLPRHTVFMPFCDTEAAANILTNAAIDPVGKIAEVKYCAVKVVPAAEKQHLT